MSILSICPKFFFLHLQLFLKRFQCQLRVICTWAHSQGEQWLVNLQLFGLLAAQGETWVSCSQGHSSLHLAVPDPTDLGGVESSCEDHSWGVGAFDVRLVTIRNSPPLKSHPSLSRIQPGDLKKTLQGFLTTKSTGQRCNGTAHLQVHGLWAPPCQSSQPGGFCIGPATADQHTLYNARNWLMW